MKRFGLLIVSLLAVVAAGCASQPEKPMVITKIVKPSIPGECLSDDPEWTIPPDADERRSETARRERENKEGFFAMRSNRAVCRAGLREIDKHGSKTKSSSRKSRT